VSAQQLGGTLEDLRYAADLAREGSHVRIEEPSLRAGAPFATESFLTPFRFNLGQSLVRRPEVTGHELLEPDPLLALGEATLGRAPVVLQPAGTAVETLDASGILEPDRRAVLLALGLALGIDPTHEGSGAGLARLCAGLDELVVVRGGNGMVAAAATDALVAAGGQLVEGVAPTAVPPRPEGLGLCRLFVGLRVPRPAGRAFLDAHGFADERSLHAALGRLRGGNVDHPVGVVVDNAHLEPRGALDERLGSFVWQGVLPSDRTVDRAAYAASVLELLGVADRDAVFRLLWLPDETGEPVGAEPWARMDATRDSTTS
jgi:hypothetical protein